MPSIGRLPPKTRAPVVDDERRNDLAKVRALQVQKAIEARNAQGLGDNTPSPFAHAIMGGLSRPISAGVEAITPWAHPGTTMGERWQGGLDAYDAGQEKQWNEHPYLSGAGNIAGSLIGGGGRIKAAKELPWLAETGYDAATSGIQTLAEGGSFSDALKDAALNSAIGGLLTGYGKSQSARKNILKGSR